MISLSMKLYFIMTTIVQWMHSPQEYCGDIMTNMSQPHNNVFANYRTRTTRIPIAPHSLYDYHFFCRLDQLQYFIYYGVILHDGRCCLLLGVYA
jgi:hypothetical protein